MFWFCGLPFLGILGSQRGGEEQHSWRTSPAEEERWSSWQDTGLFPAGGFSRFRGREARGSLCSVQRKASALDTLILFDFIGFSKLKLFLRSLLLLGNFFLCQTHLLSPHPCPQVCCLISHRARSGRTALLISRVVVFFPLSSVCISY